MALGWKGLIAHRENFGSGTVSILVWAGPFLDLNLLSPNHAYTRESNCEGYSDARLSAIYELELSRVWPKNIRTREEQVKAFAKEHGWRLRHYKDGFVAIFDKEPSGV